MENSPITQSHNEAKPWLASRQQEEHLKKQGVRFEMVFGKVAEGSRAGQYVNLDFKMLIGISIIDMLLRNELLPMTLDIEHFAKVRLLREIEARGEDGYAVVADFLAEADWVDGRGDIRNFLKDEIERSQSSAYVSGLLEKYPEHDYPVWVFMELISFGTYLRFFEVLRR